jgi:hypothetical protein
VVDINRARGTVRENISTSSEENLGYYEMKKHKPWFHKECSELLDQRIQAKLQEASQGNGRKCKTWSQQAFQE